MSDRDVSAQGTPGCGVQSYAQLHASWKERPLEVLEGTPERPLVLARVSMGRRSIWRLVSGRGTAAIYRMDEEGD